MSIYYVPGTVRCVADRAVNEAKSLFSWNLSSAQARQIWYQVVDKHIHRVNKILMEIYSYKRMFYSRVDWLGQFSCGDDNYFIFAGTLEFLATPSSD